MEKKMRIYFVFLVLLVYMGCGSEKDSLQYPVNKPTGSIILRLSSTDEIEKSETIAPDINVSIASYDISGIGPEDESFFMEGVTTDIVGIYNLIPGSWSISVVAKNSEGMIVASGDTTVVINAGEITNTSIIVTPSKGRGILLLSLSWPENTIENPIIDSTLTDNDDSIMTLNFVMASDSLSASYSNSDIESGYYILNIKLMDGDHVVWGRVDAVRIVADETTDGGYSITYDDLVYGGLDISIDVDMQNPISITFNGQQEPVLENSDMTVTAVTSEPVEGYQWYIMGDPISGEDSDTITVGSLLGKGRYRLDLIVRNDDIISSNGLTFRVVDETNYISKTLDSNGDVGESTSIAIDSGGNLHISYYDDTNGDLRYITNLSGLWISETLDSSGDVGRYTSLAIDSGDKIHISYRDNSNSALKYVTNASGQWSTETLDSEGTVGAYSSIAIDSGDQVHISYYDYTNDNLKYTTNTSAIWDMTSLDTAVSAGDYSSIAIDSGDHVHISYRDKDNNNLRYITNATGAWEAETLDSDGSVGSYTSIAIDSANYVHICYRDNTESDLKYITNATGLWEVITLDSSGSVGFHTSIAVDSEDQIHISYRDNTNTCLKYAFKVTGFWTIEAWDSIGDVGEFTSIVVDSDNHAHISYYDDANSDLKYATNSHN
ncbi:MAG: hypothetical protein SVZ03_13505 [Spirochaetota bacterium]|nr:hypothetical protein [Spirochaetota bacterium]